MKWRQRWGIPYVEYIAIKIPGSFYLAIIIYANVFREKVFIHLFEYILKNKELGYSYKRLRASNIGGL